MLDADRILRHTSSSLRWEAFCPSHFVARSTAPPTGSQWASGEIFTAFHTDRRSQRTLQRIWSHTAERYLQEGDRGLMSLVNALRNAHTSMYRTHTYTLSLSQTHTPKSRLVTVQSLWKVCVPDEKKCARAGRRGQIWRTLRPQGALTRWRKRASFGERGFLNVLYWEK